VSATLLDVLGGDDDGRAASRLISTGIASYGATAATGATDWADTEPVDDRIRRVGLAHAAVNATALGLYTASLAARKRGSLGRGRLLSMAGAGVLGVGGYLGAHLTFVRGVGPNQTAFDEGPSEWTPVTDAGSLEEGEPSGTTVGDTPVLLVRHGTAIHALHDRCSHRGCLLSDGEVEGELITCACHGSQFDLRDGSVARGPAFAPQPAFAARERDGQVEVRLRQ
jgi:nitrite reductase/ring-hydroxylating ferredoxin subunit